MPKKNYKIKTTFEADDKFSRRVGMMGKGMRALTRFAGRAKRALKATGRAAMLAGRAVAKLAKVGFVAAAAGAALLVVSVSKLASAFSTIEDAQASFTPLLGSVEKAKQLVDELNKTAATTPFQFETLSAVAQQLLPSMNGSIKDTITLTRMLGDTAGGDAQKLESITRGFNKALIKGKVDLESLNMIAEAGVPIFQQLAEQQQVSTGKLFKQISQGKIKIDNLEGVFKTMTNEGGIFFRGMEIASETLSGKISTLKDNVTLAAAELGGALAPILKDLADEGTDLAKQAAAWVKQNREMIKTKVTQWAKKVKERFIALYKWLRKNEPKIRAFVRELLALATGVKDFAFALYRFKDSIIALAAGFVLLKTAMAGFKLVGMATELASVGGAAAKAAPLIGSLGNALGKGGLVLAAGAAGVAIGLLINKLLGAAEKKELNLQNLAVKSQVGLGNQGFNDMLENRRRILAKKQKITKGSDTFDKGGFLENESVVEANRAIKAIDAEIARREKTALSGPRGMFAGDAQGRTQTDFSGQAPPQTQGGTTETVTREEIELIIRDETGKSEVTKNTSGNGLTLATTGGM